MWGNVDPEVGTAREQQLAAEFIRPALDNGAQLHRYHDTTGSAHQIIRTILNNHRTALQVQRELVDEKRDFNRTTVGEEINREVDESKGRLEQEIGELQHALETAKGREKETRSQLEGQIAELQKIIGKLANESRNMNTDYNKKKVAAVKRFSKFLRSPVGFGVSCVVLGVLYYLLV